MALKENYKDDILDVSVNTKRKYRMTENQDGTISLDDETVYTQEGDNFGASDMNATNTKVNALESDIGEINDNLTASNQTAGVSDVPFRFGCDDDGNFGYIINEGGADTVIPFKSGSKELATFGQTYHNSHLYFLNIYGNSSKNLIGNNTTATTLSGEYIKLEVRSMTNLTVKALQKAKFKIYKASLSMNEEVSYSLQSVVDADVNDTVYTTQASWNDWIYITVE